MDRRLYNLMLVALALVLSTAMGYVVIYFDNRLSLDPSTHFGAIFASWVAGVALFVTATLAVSIISFYKPEMDTFEARAKILFKGQRGRHYEYISEKLRSILESYIESATRTVSIEYYDGNSESFYVTSLSEAVVKAYINDISTKHVTSLKIEEVTNPPKAVFQNKINFCRIDGFLKVSPRIFGDSFLEDVEGTIEPEGALNIDVSFSNWMKADFEDATHRRAVYTNRLSLRFENAMTSAVSIVVQDGNGHNRSVTLLPGERRDVLTAQQIKPHEICYSYRLIGPNAKSPDMKLSETQ